MMDVPRETTEKTTAQRLYERYDALMRGGAPGHSTINPSVFASFRRTLRSWLPTDPNATILDVGCGNGALLLFLRGMGYTCLDGFDISPDNLSSCRAAGLDFVQQWNALEIKNFSPAQQFDCIVALDILEHLPKDHAARFVEDARMRLRRGGTLIIQTPNMGSVLGNYMRYGDLSHEFGVTERSIVHLLRLGGFTDGNIEVKPTWNATTLPGRLREIYLRLLHFLVFAAEGRSRPRIPTKNLLIKAIRE